MPVWYSPLPRPGPSGSQEGFKRLIHQWIETSNDIYPPSWNFRLAKSGHRRDVTSHGGESLVVAKLKKWLAASGDNGWKWRRIVRALDVITLTSTLHLYYVRILTLTALMNRTGTTLGRDLVLDHFPLGAPIYRLALKSCPTWTLKLTANEDRQGSVEWMWSFSTYSC